MTDNIKATVFIPTYYGEDNLDELFTALCKQKVDFEYEILVIDTSSKDRTPEIIRSWAPKFQHFRYETITKPEFSHGRVRQQAAEMAQGEYVVYLTQDATPAHDRWLYEIIQPMERIPQVAGVMGKQDPRPTALPLLKEEIIRTFAQFGPDFGTSVFYEDEFIDSQQIFDLVTFYSDVNSAARKSVLLDDVPYQDIPYAEDQKFGEDLVRHGYMKAYAPRANVWHTNEIKLRDYKKRMFDEIVGVRRVGKTMDPISIPFVIKQVVRALTLGSRFILRDGQYSWKRKLYWLVVNPLFVVEKWKGVRAAIAVNLKDEQAIANQSLESSEQQRHES